MTDNSGNSQDNVHDDFAKKLIEAEWPTYLATFSAILLGNSVNESSHPRASNNPNLPMPDRPALFSIHAVSAEHVLPLRRTILLGGQSDSCRFRGDDEPATLHIAVYQNERVIAVATVCREALPGLQNETAWRLRGVAVEPHARGYGFGRTLIKLCVGHAHRQGGRLAWCTARESARGFYEALGFASSSPPFKLPSRGDLLFYEMHYVLPGEPISDVE